MLGFHGCKRKRVQVSDETPSLSRAQQLRNACCTRTRRVFGERDAVAGRRASLRKIQGRETAAPHCMHIITDIYIYRVELYAISLNRTADFLA